MKRVIICLMMMVACSSSFSQVNLAVSPFFDNNSVYAPYSKIALVKGAELVPYHLTLYRSCSAVDGRIIKEMERAVTTDSRKAVDKELGYIGQRLYYAFLSLPPEAKDTDVKRYIFYRNAFLKAGGKYDATIVYMEGTVTMKELKKLFK